MIKSVKNPESRATNKHIDASEYIDEVPAGDVEDMLREAESKSGAMSRIIRALRNISPFKKKKHNPVRVKAGVGHIHVDITSHRHTEDPEIELLNLVDMFIARWSDKLTPNNNNAKRDPGIR